MLPFQPIIIGGLDTLFIGTFTKCGDFCATPKVTRGEMRYCDHAVEPSLSRPSMSERKPSRRYFLSSALAASLSVVLADLRRVFGQIDAGSSIPKRAKSTRMDEGRPSATAWGAAMYRGAHQILDDPRILDDPIALRIIGANAESALRSNPERWRFPIRLHLPPLTSRNKRLPTD